jgi:hypothetical protein
VVSIMSQLLFSGGMIWVTDRILLDQLSWGTPMRWGYAASASTINIDKLVPGLASPNVPVTNRIGLDQLSWAVPSRWGFAAQASTVDLWTIEPGPIAPKDSHFKHTAGTWLFDVGMLLVLTIVYASFVGWRSRLKRH